VAIRTPSPVTSESTGLRITLSKERAFLCVDGPLLDLARAQPGVVRGNADHRNVNGWKNISGNLDQDKGRDQEQKQRRYYKRVRPIKS
jgi:hypothetical protein